MAARASSQCGGGLSRPHILALDRMPQLWSRAHVPALANARRERRPVRVPKPSGGSARLACARPPGHETPFADDAPLARSRTPSPEAGSPSLRLGVSEHHGGGPVELGHVGLRVLLVDHREEGVALGLGLGELPAGLVHGDLREHLHDDAHDRVLLILLVPEEEHLPHGHVRAARLALGLGDVGLLGGLALHGVGSLGFSDDFLPRLGRGRRHWRHHDRGRPARGDHG
mmetsp:Transcript_21011/g.70565  ORF Transcript_21011/g.70565 Transcript_21011/m.70565 type:complete len:228 (+) Transcript_21011:57-740(+)